MPEMPFAARVILGVTAIVAIGVSAGTVIGLWRFARKWRKQEETFW